jgi:phage protein D
MSGMLPYIEVSVGGRPVSGAFYQQLSSATIHDAPGQESDSVELKFDDGGNVVEVPAYGALIEVRFGFRDAAGGAAKMGLFTYERSSIEGGERGETLTLSGRSADRRDELKEPDSEHWDDATIGGVVAELAGRHGYGSFVDGELAAIRLPYLARLNQSTLDLLTRLADRNRALFAVKDRKLVLRRRGVLPAVTIARSECAEWSFQVEPRPRYGSTEAGWFDRARGEMLFESHSTGLEGPRKRLRTIQGSAAEAQAAAAAEGDRLGRATGSGSLTLAGRPEIGADQPIECTGFRTEANGLWRCAGVDHRFDRAYTTTISLGAGEEGKS